jgi:type VI secretion system protein ImpA
LRLPTLKVSSDNSIDTSADNIALNSYIKDFYGYSLDELLAPIKGEQKSKNEGAEGETVEGEISEINSEVGDSVRHNGVYFIIKEARRADDPTLPQGVWSHDLKAADWDVVEKTALNALSLKSKDLQLGVWLMESSINRYGFAGIAPAAVVIRRLCQTYWDNMHPQMQDGDIEFRTNPINWLNQKLSLQLRLVSITQAPIDGAELSWDDWDQAQRIEQLKRQQRQEEIKWDGPTTDAFKQRLAATNKEFLITLCEQIDDANQAIKHLIDWFDEQCGNDSPSLGEITQINRAVNALARDELQRRGIRLAALTDDNNGNSQPDAAGQGGSSSSGAGAGDDGGFNGEGGVLKNRADAFARLREAAEFLMRDDPHSPVPYMVYTACDWGEKTAPDLYQELFLSKGGQLNIFEMMGLEVTS